MNSLQNKLSIPTDFTWIVNAQSQFCVSDNNARPGNTLYNRMCDHIDNTIYWRLEKATDNGYYFFNKESKKYLNFNEGKVGILGSKLLIRIEPVGEKWFRMTVDESGKKFCFDSFIGSGCWLNCDESNHNSLRFLYYFHYLPYQPPFEINTFYLLVQKTPENTEFSIRPLTNNLPLDNNQYFRIGEAMDNEASNHYKFVQHPTKQGVFQIINKDNFAFQIVWGTCTYFPCQTHLEFKKPDIAEKTQFFRITRSPFNPEKFFIRSNDRDNTCLFKTGELKDCPNADLRDYLWSIRKICGTKFLRENFWYHFKTVSWQYGKGIECITSTDSSSIKFEECEFSDNQSWKVNWDPVLEGYIIHHKASGKVLTASALLQINLQTLNPKGDLAQRWGTGEHSVNFPLSFEFRNRKWSNCFSGREINYCSFVSQVLPMVFMPKIHHFDVLGKGYYGECLADSIFNLNKGLLPTPEPPAPQPVALPAKPILTSPSPSPVPVPVSLPSPLPLVTKLSPPQTLPKILSQPTSTPSIANISPPGSRCRRRRI